MPAGLRKWLAGRSCPGLPCVAPAFPREPRAPVARWLAPNDSGTASRAGHIAPPQRAVSIVALLLLLAACSPPAYLCQPVRDREAEMYLLCRPSPGAFVYDE